MIVLTVMSYNGTPAAGPQAGFDELGGTIGRADNNQLVLPDPERTISRVHARIVFRAGGYTIVDNGSNPISVNGQVLGSGREQPLKGGDQVQIGGYLLAVSEGQGAAAAADPFADLFGGDVPQGLAQPGTPPPPERSAMLSWPKDPTPAPAPSLAPGVIPDDWDPFADPAPAPATRAAPAPAGGGIDLPLEPASRQTLDDLFGLDPSLRNADPLGGAPQEQLAMQPNMAGSADPLEALMRPAAIARPTAPERGSELNTPMPLPPPAQQPAGAVFSWDEPGPGARRVGAPARADIELPSVPPPLPPMPAPMPPPAPARPPIPVLSQAIPPPLPASGLPGDPTLLAALLDGLGAGDLRIDRLTPDMMRLLGQLLRESTRGAVELLAARAALKRELRAEVTMIVARENNPLKFSPSVEVALQHLMGPPAPGFMPAVPAVRDAFDDLRAHQIAVMAGMKAALDGVLHRFDPQQLEAKLTSRSALDSLIPSTRKARLWELFTELFGQLTAEAQDDFDELFGKAFRRAYEAQLDRLANEAGPR